MIGLLMMLATAPGSDFINGNQLYDYCQRPTGTVCLAYVMAVTDAVSDLASAGTVKRMACPSINVVPLQIKDVVVKYLAEHPASRGQGAAGLTKTALIDAFPCPKGG